MEIALNVSDTFVITFGLLIFDLSTLPHKPVFVLQMIEDVLGEGPVSASRFSQWFSSNLSPSGSHSSSLRSTPHEELEKLAGKFTGLHDIKVFLLYFVGFQNFVLFLCRAWSTQLLP